MRDFDETHRLLALAATMRQKATRAPPHMRSLYLSLAAKCEARLYGPPHPVPDSSPPRADTKSED